MCKQSIDHSLKELKQKLDFLCRRVDKMDSHEKRMSDMEHDMQTHSSRMNGQDKKFTDHLEWGGEQIKKQEARDGKMDDDIRGLQKAITEMTVALVESKGALTAMIDTKINAVVAGWRKLVLSAAGVMLVTCFSAIGTLVMFIFYVQAQR